MTPAVFCTGVLTGVFCLAHRAFSAGIPCMTPVVSCMGALTGGICFAGEEAGRGDREQLHFVSSGDQHHVGWSAARVRRSGLSGLVFL